MAEEKRKLVILAGPTAAGKTALSVTLARRLGAEIISADSMQVYRHMDIGSAKIRPGEMQGIPHHLIDCLDPTEPFDVTRFQNLALSAMEGIYERGRIPLITGGTGFYIQSVLYGIDFTDSAVDTPYRASLEALAEAEGRERLHGMLKEVDPAAAEAIPAGNLKRVIRALEFYRSTGRRISDHNAEEREKRSPYDFRYFVLELPREILYERINERVEEMVKEGLFSEVERLRELGVSSGMTSMQGIGYRQIMRYFDGYYGNSPAAKETAVEDIKKETRHFAKRQITWFKREKDVIRVPLMDFPDREAVIQFMLEKTGWNSGT